MGRGRSESAAVHAVSGDEKWKSIPVRSRRGLANIEHCTWAAMRRAALGSNGVIGCRLSSVLDPFDTCHELSRLYVNKPRFSSAQATRRLDSSRVPSQTQVA